MIEISKLGQELSGADLGGFTWNCELIDSDIPVLKVTIAGREELPIFISRAGDEVLCMCYLFDESQVEESRRAEMLEVMLRMNLPMPLSSFGKLQDQYIVFGALSANSSLESLIREVTTLSDNSIEAIGAMSEYLR